MKCPWCGGPCQLVKEEHTKKVCGRKLRILGFKIKEKTEYWVCPNCGNKFKVENR